MEKKKVLITGGKGFIGSHLYKAMSYCDVSIYDIVNTRINDNTVSLNLSEDMNSVLKNKYDIIFHLAANSSVESCDISGYLNNIDVTAKILEKALNDGSQVIFTSSWLAEYPNSSLYAQSKAACEKLCKFYRIKGVDVRTARLSNVYGPNANKSSIVSKLMSGEDVKLYKNYFRDFIHVYDVVKSIIVLSDIKYDYFKNTTMNNNELYLCNERLQVSVLAKFLNLELETVDCPSNVIDSCPIMINDLAVLYKPKFTLEQFIYNSQYSS